MRIKDFQILIPKYNSNSGTWRDAKDVYANDQPGYVPEYRDWRCVFCHNINFRRRKQCYNPNCRAPKDYTLTKAGNKDDAAPVTGKKEEDANVTRSIKDWMNLIKEAENMTVDAHMEEKMDFFMVIKCACVGN